MTMIDAPERTITPEAIAAAHVEEEQTLGGAVDKALQHYFGTLGDQSPSELYELVLAEVEKPLLEVVMQYTRGNQSKAAIILGISRGTLRKKLKQHGLL